MGQQKFLADSQDPTLFCDVTKTSILIRAHTVKSHELDPCMNIMIYTVLRKSSFNL